MNARKFLFAPDVVPQTTTNPYDTLLIGSGDREHPLDTSIQSRYYMINDDHALNAVRSTPITEGPAGAPTGTAGKLFDVTSDTVQVGTSDQIAAAKAALTTASAWYITHQAGEKVVSGSTTLSGSPAGRSGFVHIPRARIDRSSHRRIGAEDDDT